MMNLNETETKTKFEWQQEFWQRAEAVGTLRRRPADGLMDGQPLSPAYPVIIANDFPRELLNMYNNNSEKK
jgi:hypothetical protein